MLFADPRNVCSLAYRVACRPLTDEERILIRKWAQQKFESNTRFKGRMSSDKEQEHLRRIIHEPSYLDHIEVHDHVGESWDLPK